MKLVQAICPSCGKVAEIDEYSRSFKCEFCNNTTIIEKEHKNYVDDMNDDNFKAAHELIYDHHDFKKAKEKYESVLRRSPNNPNAIWGIIICYTKEFTEKLYFEVPNNEPQWFVALDKNIQDKYEEYLKCETLQTRKAENVKTFEEYMNNNKQEFEKLKNNKNTNIEVVEDNKVENNEEIINEKNQNNVPAFIFLCVAVVIVILVIVFSNIFVGSR